MFILYSASKGWYDLLLSQHNRHRAVAELDSGDGEVNINKLTQRMLANSKQEMETQRQSDIRFPID